MEQIMRQLCLVLVGIVSLVNMPLCSAITFPVLTSSKITSCSDFAGSKSKSKCNENVNYQGVTQLLEIGSPTSPSPEGRIIQAYGIHCSVGDKSQGIPYTGCMWTIDGHAPTVTNCAVLGDASRDNPWALTANSTCNADTTWGYHSGASPGGECVLFGIRWNSSSLQTPYGIYSAETVANAGNQYCIKPLAPSVVCSVSLPPAIDHNVLVAGTTDRKFIDGAVNCGARPAVTVVGGPRFVLAPDVTTDVSTAMQSNTQLRIQSDMTVGPMAKAGQYSAAVIVSVSPY